MNNKPKIHNLIGTVLSAALFLAMNTASAAAETPRQAVSAELSGRPLQQVALTTRSLETAIAFYRDTLGLPFLFESNGMAFFDMAGIRLMIALDEARPEGKPTSILYFDVPDFHDAVDRLKNASVELDGPIETVQETKSGKLKIQQFRDLDGNALALIGTVHD